MSDQQGTTYSAFIQRQMVDERSRRTSLDERGWRLQQSCVLTLGLISTAIGLLGGPGALARGWALVILGLSAGTLVAAYVCGLQAAGLRWYVVADSDTMNKMLTQQWGDTEVDSRNIVAGLDLQLATSLREGNKAKAEWITWGLWFQGAGVALGFISVVFVASTAL